MKEKKKEVSYVSDDIRNTVALAKQFKELVDCIGNSVQVAQVVPEFKRSLKPTEVAKLEKSNVGNA